MRKRLFDYLKGDGTRGSRVDRWLLFIGALLLFLGVMVRFFQQFSAIGPESGFFFVVGAFISFMAVIGIGSAKFGGNHAGKNKKGAR